MFTIDFTKPCLYKDIIYFNQSNLTYQKIMSKFLGGESREKI